MFDIIGDRINLSADSLAIPPFKEHYEGTKDKAKALKEIEYVIWLYKFSTPYLAYPPSERASRVAKDIFKDDKYQPSEAVKQLIVRYNEFQNTLLIRLYNAAENGLEYNIELLNNLRSDVEASDLTLEDKLKVGERISKILKDVEPTAKSLDSAKKRAMAEQVETGKVKGGGQVGLYELPRN